MKKQTVETTVIKSKNGVVQKVHCFAIYQPKPKFKGGSAKWYKD